MTTSHDDKTSTDSGNPDIEKIQADIEQTRQELGETVDALTAKLDVKGRAKSKLDDTKQRAAGQVQVAQARATDLTRNAKSSATTADGKPTPTVLATVAGVVVTVLAAATLAIVRKRR